ncbi:hypothetical protein ACIRD2_02525 [Streptomyces sp. NPDC093595]|uniref:hypothetical protein n=1 Tax=Streptomyces sp. NPDC093595 TaxID=3366045 RepID=UPI0037FF9F29
MKYSEKAMANGWGWVLGVSGQECRVIRAGGRADADVNGLPEALDRIGGALHVTYPLGAGDPKRVELILDAIRRLQQGRERALQSAALAWKNLNDLGRDERGGLER